MAEPAVNIRHFSVKCGRCDRYQTLIGYARRQEWNIYTYQCENEICDPALSRTLIEVHRDVDDFARRDQEWRGGGRHGGHGDGAP